MLLFHVPSTYIVSKYLEASLPQIPPIPPPRKADTTPPPQLLPKSYEVSKKIIDAHSPKLAELELTRPATILIEGSVIDKVTEKIKKESPTDLSESEKSDSASSSGTYRSFLVVHVDYR